MNTHKIGIITDSVCDMPKSVIEENDIGVIHFYVTTETGVFRDGEEITSQNVIEYYRKGGAALVTAPAVPEEYAECYRSYLARYDEVIHIAVSSGTSASYEHAKAALVQLGELADRVKLFDSQTLSTGMAHLVLKAVGMRDSGCTSEGIITALEDMRKRINVSFIARGTEEMRKNGRISERQDRICRLLHVHPIFRLKNGEIELGGIAVGNMQGATKRYIRRKLRKRSAIDTSRLFITHVGLSISELAAVKAEVAKRISFDETIVTDASAAVSGSSGEGTLGVLFVEK